MLKSRKKPNKSFDNIEDKLYYDYLHEAVEEARNEPGPGIPNEEVEAKFRARREALRERLKK
jgi:hypothetical protein